VWFDVEVHGGAYGGSVSLGRAVPARDSTGRVWGSRDELVELLPVRGIELWWLVWEVLEEGGGELELVLVNGGPVLELGLAIAQRTSGEGEEGRQWQGAREGRQGPGSGLGKADGRSSVRLCSRKKKGVNVRARDFGNR